MLSRNIVTKRDAAAANTGNGVARPGGARQVAMGSTKAGHVEADRWYSRLMKYIPGEALALYLGLDKLAPPGWAAVEWLTAATFVAVAFNILYLIRVWEVERWVQIAASTVALLAYIYATGGVFAAVGIAPPRAQAFVLFATGAFLTFFEPPRATSGTPHVGMA